MFGIGAQELIIIFFIVLLLFGANRIPEIAKGMGRGIRDFKKATQDIEEDLNLREDPPRIHPRPESASTAGREKQPERETDSTKRD